MSNWMGHAPWVGTITRRSAFHSRKKRDRCRFNSFPSSVAPCSLSLWNLQIHCVRIPVSADSDKVVDS